jgi:Flp pilus assembly protein CpaB
VGALLLCLGSVGGVFLVKRAATNARMGWNLVPVVVAAVDIPAKTTVTMEMIAQRSIPEQFVTSSVVQPDGASYIVNQKVLVPLQAGDPLRWSDFDIAKKIRVLFAVKDVVVGSVLWETDVEEREVDHDLVTDSWVLNADRPQAIGRTLIAPFRKGDPIMWTHLQAKGAK